MCEKEEPELDSFSKDERRAGNNFIMQKGTGNNMHYSTKIG